MVMGRVAEQMGIKTVDGLQKSIHHDSIIITEEVFLEALEKGVITGFDEEFDDNLEKGMRDRSHLQKKVITTSKGHKMTVYVKPSDGKTGEKQFNPNGIMQKKELTKEDVEKVKGHEHKLSHINRKRFEREHEKHFGKDTDKTKKEISNISIKEMKEDIENRRPGTINGGSQDKSRTDRYIKSKDINSIQDVENLQVGDIASIYLTRDHKTKRKIKITKVVPTGVKSPGGNNGAGFVSFISANEEIKEGQREGGKSINEFFEAIKGYPGDKNSKDLGEVGENIRQWSSSQYSDSKIHSIISSMSDAGIDDKELRIQRTPNWTQEKESRAIDRKVKDLRQEHRDGLEHAGLKSKDIDEILYGMVRTAMEGMDVMKYGRNTSES